MDSISYSLGVLIAQNLKNQGFKDVKSSDLAAGIDDVLAGRELKINLQECNNTIQDYSTKQREKESGALIEGGKKFLEENGKRKEVVTLPSGLQYEIIKAGNGPKPAATDQVTVHYHGTLIDGTVFDSSVKRGEPATFPVNGVIQGWVEALQLMPVGSKWKLFIPYNLAYGERGAGQSIKPYSTLIFEVELLSIGEK
ncbi:MAG: FKBP-type peptidyl-prolyl cis-trans isomerase [Saprospiraceae bacterium]|nr:FKBP-type peptidyl-prolyl cis-trans isomerase [Saprospiraceae bacterium]